MKIIIVLLTHIDNLPPARNLLLCLAKTNIAIELITMYSSALPASIKKASNIHIIDLQTKMPKDKIDAIKKRLLRRHKLRSVIQSITDAEDIIWTLTDYDAMEVGRLLNNYRHVIQLMELIDDIPYFDEIPFIKAHISNYANTAEMVIVPEYNRAYIQQAIWNLDKTPYVIPNKPVIDCSDYTISEDAEKVLKMIGHRKIVLYQGTFGYERELDKFIEAVEVLGDEYCVLLMGRNDKELQKILNKYPFVFFIPFISSPNHLAVTQRAHIGILSYVNTNGIRHYNPLNAIYCAPNKIFEYAAFGVPMIGNNIPGLEIPFSLYNIGFCSKLDKDEIADTILKIEQNYDFMRKSCMDYYKSVDLDYIVNLLLNKLIK